VNEGDDVPIHIELPWSRPPLSMNDRRHWRAHAKEVKIVREAAWLLAKSHGLCPVERIRVGLHYQPRDNRHRDSDNLAATYKPLVDGLKDAGIVPDDTDRFVERSWPVIHPAVKGECGRMWLEITILGEAA
jgi:crossover junction endodeoxyribonuclease RusA